MRITLTFYAAIRTGSRNARFFCFRFYPAVRTGSSNTRFLFFLFFGGHLPQNSARSKQYLPVIFVRLAFIRQNVRKLW